MNEPRWKKELRGLFFVLVILAGISGLISAYFDIAYHKAGAEQPTAEKTVENIQHAKKKYISVAESERIYFWWTLFLIGFPSALLFGLVLRFAFKVDIFKREPLPPRIVALMDKFKEKQI